MTVKMPNRRMAGFVVLPARFPFAQPTETTKQYLYVLRSTPRFHKESSWTVVESAAAALAAFIAISILAAVVNLFQSRGAPMERLAAAERACLTRVYQSEREACMKRWLAETKSANVAQK